MRDHVIAVDVGTGSARAGVVDRNGHLLVRCEHPILLRRPQDERGEHASEDIWRACCHAVRGALQQSGIAADRIAALAFDATCSLVLRDHDGGPLALDWEDGEAFDTIAWLDHRATLEAEDCNRTGHPTLAHCGGSISPEMQMPKLMWLKRHRPDLWERAGYLFDLSDFLTWRATGSTERSVCTLTSKWNFVAGRVSGWQADFLRLIGLDDLVEKGTLPDVAVPVGAPVGRLSASAAAELGLDQTVSVAAGMVDAYAGALGVLGGVAADPQALHQQTALVGGTSSCIITFAGDPQFGKSLWGPYRETVFAGQWLIEAGQSATGALLGHLLRLHSLGGDPTPERHQQVIARVQQLRASEGASFADRINILPDFHGNRSPFADPHLTGVITGLTLDTSFDGLCRLYWRACVAIALGLRQILETMSASGMPSSVLHLTGGHVKNPLLVELYADVTGCELVIPDSRDAVLVGTAMNAAAAGGLYSSLTEAGAAMAPSGERNAPNPASKGLYDRDYVKFLTMQRHRVELNGL